jgi:Domain of unknown function (DUF4398)
MKSALTALFVFAAAATAGCSAAPAPNARLASTQASVRGAQEIGAASVPEASLHLKFSQEQITQAKALIAEGNTEQADVVLQQAQADAELALALTRENTATVEMRRLQGQVQTRRGGK